MRRRAEPANVLYRIKRGLSSYVSYLAACEMNEAFSEYVLYEPILRILTAREYKVKCEYPCPGIVDSDTGDKKRLDFFATRQQVELAIEVKWAKTAHPKIDNDLKKLRAVLDAKPDAVAVLCVFGRKSDLVGLKLEKHGLRERGEMIVADLKRTRFACRIYQLNRRRKFIIR